jgi:SAM-dependent methyltransferase
VVTTHRWQAAQGYERAYWQGVADRLATGSPERLDWYRWSAQHLATRLRQLGLGTLVDGNARVLEVGSGPVGTISFVPAAERVAVDPLEDFYRDHAALIEVRDAEVDYRAGQGEALPVEDGRFDLALAENCLDHVQDMDAVLQEIRRALRDRGLLFIRINARTAFGFVVHRILSVLRIDTGHPHSLTPDRLLALLQRNGFEVVDSYFPSWHEQQRRAGWRERLKELAGVHERVLHVFARNTA